MINEFQKPFSKEGEKNFERIFGASRAQKRARRKLVVGMDNARGESVSRRSILEIIPREAE